MMIHCKVWHPDHPMVEVDSTCRIDAIMQAAHMWDVDTSEILADVKVTAKKADIEAAIKEREARQMSFESEGF